MEMRGGKEIFAAFWNFCSELRWPKAAFSLSFSSSSLGWETLPLRLRNGKCCLCGYQRKNVESDNDKGWEVVPASCVSYVGEYMEMGQYDLDFKYAVNLTLAYVNDLELKGDGKDAWVFDIDDTTLSTLSYHRLHQYGGEVFNDTAFTEWEEEGNATVLPYSLQLYNTLLAKGVKIFFITGRREKKRESTTKNLDSAGYKNWTGLIMRGTSYQATKAAYKSEKREELVKEGYRILGNVGDQWSDITGTSVGSRTFKIPNPMYYTA